MPKFYCEYLTVGDAIQRLPIEAESHQEAYECFIEKTDKKNFPVSVCKGTFGRYQTFYDHVTNREDELHEKDLSDEIQIIDRTKETTNKMKYNELENDAKIPRASDNVWANLYMGCAALAFAIAGFFVLRMIGGKDGWQDEGQLAFIYFSLGITWLFVSDMIAKFHVIEHYSRQTARQIALTNAILLKSQNEKYVPPITEKEIPIEEETGS